MSAIIAPRGRGEEGMSESHLRKLPAKNAGVDFDGADGDDGALPAREHQPS